MLIYREISEEAIKKTQQVLIDNGIEADEAETVLQAIGYTLLDAELYPQFTWNEEEEDHEVSAKGVLVMWATGSKDLIQKFVEDLSRRCGAKADWSYTSGRAHIEIMPNGANAAFALINDVEYMSQFYVPYNNGEPYFERLD